MSNVKIGFDIVNWHPKKRFRSELLSNYDVDYNIDYFRHFSRQRSVDLKFWYELDTMSIYDVDYDVDYKIDILNYKDVNMMLTTMLITMLILMKNRFDIVECTMSKRCRFTMSNTLSKYDFEIGSVFSTLAYGFDFQQKSTSYKKLFNVDTMSNWFDIVLNYTLLSTNYIS